MKWLPVIIAALSLTTTAAAQAQGTAREHARSLGKDIDYRVEGQVTFAGAQSPLWLNANKYGLSSVTGDNGYLRVAAHRSLEADSAYNWKFGYGADFAAAYNFTSSFVVQQLYADIQYRKVRVSIGSKERPANLKNPLLSSGSQAFGTNARPIPEVRFEIPEYISITGPSNWLAIKGHFGYGIFTDGRWREDYVGPGGKYAKHILYHSKAGFLRIGNEEKFPLTLEGGIEMACQFGGTIYNYNGAGDNLQMGHSIKDFIKAIYSGGGDPTDGVYTNAAGNTVGSWLFSLSYKGPTWKVRAYYDHFFEDHSQLFFEYGWRDGLLGFEVELPRNPWVSTLVYEHIYTKDQSGPLYHDYTAAIPDQISARDGYYGHGLYTSWTHWGQPIGNPLYQSPLYQGHGNLSILNNRFIGHHFGISGSPNSELDYRLLYTYTSNWGTYGNPYDEIKYGNSFLCELSYHPRRIGRLDTRGWSARAAFALDRGAQTGSHTGFQLTLAKTGWLTRH